MAYGPQCEELARHFLLPQPHDTMTAFEADVKQLAQHIQNEVEKWILAFGPKEK